ncbi:MAG TPA: hypothetical protein VFN24_14100 [Microbacterium sp.]|nr:hypothetical protein [Microbacterium sp.]
MPTALPRIQVTRTPELEAALEVAAREWPDAPLSERVSRLATAGARAVSGAEAAARHEMERRSAVEKYRGAFADAFPPGYLEELRKDWPE